MKMRRPIRGENVPVYAHSFRCLVTPVRKRPAIPGAASSSLYIEARELEDCRALRWYLLVHPVGGGKISEAVFPFDGH